MANFKVAPGQTLGFLTVIRRLGPIRLESGNHSIYWEVECECGELLEIAAGFLNPNYKAHQKACKGCFHSKIKAKHGFYGTKIYKTWDCMKQRCYNENHDNYHNYGGRGIVICPEWKYDFQAFYDYVSTLDSYDPKLQIDRIDNDGNYEPGNVRFVTPKQNMNNRRNNVYVEMDGQRMSFRDAVDKYDTKNLGWQIIESRMKKGVSFEQALIRAYKERGPKKPTTLFDLDGVEMSADKVLDTTGNIVSYNTFFKRIGAGWSVREAATRPSLRSTK